MEKNTVVKRYKSLPGNIVIGTAISLMLALLIAAILALTIASGKLSSGTMGYGVLVLLILSSVTGAGWASKGLPSGKIFACLLTSICYAISLLCVNVLFFGGQFRGIPATLMIIIAGGVVAGLLPAGQGRAAKKRNRKRRYG